MGQWCDRKGSSHVISKIYINNSHTGNLKGNNQTLLCGNSGWPPTASTLALMPRRPGLLSFSSHIPRPTLAGLHLYSSPNNPSSHFPSSLSWSALPCLPPGHFCPPGPNSGLSPSRKCSLAPLLQVPLGDGTTPCAGSPFRLLPRC